MPSPYRAKPVNFQPLTCNFFEILPWPLRRKSRENIEKRYGEARRGPSLVLNRGHYQTMPMRPLYTRSVHRASPAPVRRDDGRPSAFTRGYDRVWQALRRRFLTKNPCCCFCHRLATAVDHIRPLAAGGDRLNEKNLRPVCVECHAKLTTNFKRYGVNEMTVSGSE